MKTFIKKKSGPNQAGPKYRTSDHFRAGKFGKNYPKPSAKFKPAQFKLRQHKG
jgi:hypothetical protein